MRLCLLGKRKISRGRDWRERGWPGAARVRPSPEVFDTATYLGDVLAEGGNAVEGDHAKNAEGLFICAL